MEQTKLCPRCGKNIPAGRTYCMSCGASVATKCPDCGKILPLNPKVCDGCGHSFVRKTVKAKKAKPVNFAKLYRILLWALSGVMLVCQIVFVCLDAIRITVPDVLDLHAGGLGLFAYFFGTQPEGLDVYLDLFKLTEENILGASLALQAAGVLYFGALICTLIYALVVGFNLLRFGPKSVKHMTLWAAIVAGLDALASVLCMLAGAGLASRLRGVEKYVEDGIAVKHVTPFVLIFALLLLGKIYSAQVENADGSTLFLTFNKNMKLLEASVYTYAYGYVELEI